MPQAVQLAVADAGAAHQDGAHAAWLLTQHADLDLDFQRGCLALLAAAADAGEAAAVDHAYLADRVAVAEGLLL